MNCTLIRRFALAIACTLTLVWAATLSRTKYYNSRKYKPGYCCRVRQRDRYRANKARIQGRRWGTRAVEGSNQAYEYTV